MNDDGNHNHEWLDGGIEWGTSSWLLLWRNLWSAVSLWKVAWVTFAHVSGPPPADGSSSCSGCISMSSMRICLGSIIVWWLHVSRSGRVEVREAGGVVTNGRDHLRCPQQNTPWDPVMFRASFPLSLYNPQPLLVVLIPTNITMMMMMLLEHLFSMLWRPGWSDTYTTTRAPERVDPSSPKIIIHPSLPSWFYYCN